MTTTKPKDVLTTGDVSRLCNVAPRTVTKWFDSGQLRGYLIPGSRDRRIPLSQLIRFLRQNNMPVSHLSTGLLRILIIDSDQHRNEYIVQSLGNDGMYLIRTAESLFEAGIASSGFNPNLIFINITLEDADIKSLCQDIHRIDQFANTRIIAVIPPLRPGEIDAIKALGFDDCLPEPFTLTNFIECVSENISIL